MFMYNYTLYHSLYTTGQYTSKSKKKILLVKISYLGRQERSIDL